MTVGVKTWGSSLRGKRLRIFCDNQATVAVINSGRTRDNFMLKCMRELAFHCASFECTVRAVFLPGVENRVADSLSRRHLSGKSEKQSHLAGGLDLRLIELKNDVFEFNSKF